MKSEKMSELTTNRLGIYCLAEYAFAQDQEYLSQACPAINLNPSDQERPWLFR